MSSVQDEVTAALRALHDQYVFDLNDAIAEGRDDLVAKLVAEYPNAALEVMAG